MHEHFLGDFLMSMPHYRDICLSPAVAWRNIHKQYILHIVKERVYGSWAEFPKNTFARPVLVSELFCVALSCEDRQSTPQKTSRNNPECNEGVHSKSNKGIGEALQLTKKGYPINVNMKNPLLKMTKRSDVEAATIAKRATKQRELHNNEQKNWVLQYMKSTGKPLCLRHLYLSGETSGVGV